MWVAARWHKAEVSLEYGLYPTTDEKNKPVNATLKSTMTWWSEILLGRIHTSNWSLLEPMRKVTVSPPHNASGEWVPCIPPYGGYAAVNNSVTQIISIGGLEDPRLMWLPDGTLGLTFQSLPPQGSPLSTLAVRGLEGDQVFDPNSDECFTKGRLYRAIIPHKRFLADSFLNTSIPSKALLYEKAAPFNTEKNWMSFFQDGKEKYVRTMFPHRVLDVGPSTATVINVLEGDLGSVDSRLLVSKKSSVVYHGGANALLMKPAKEGNCTGRDWVCYIDRYPDLTKAFGKNTAQAQAHYAANGKKEGRCCSCDVHYCSYYLSSFHSIEAGKYRNYLYKFAPWAPYPITAVSGLLPMLGAPLVDRSIGKPLAFNSGLAAVNFTNVHVPPTCVKENVNDTDANATSICTRSRTVGLILSYGSSNAESRALFIPESWYAHFFEKDD